MRGGHPVTLIRSLFEYCFPCGNSLLLVDVKMNCHLRIRHLPRFRYGLGCIPVPVTLSLLWHKRCDKDMALIWLKDVLRKVMADLTQPSSCFA